MHISFSPRRSDKTLSVSKEGDALIVNGERYDFSSIPEGGKLPHLESKTGMRTLVPSEWFDRPIERRNGKLYLTLALPHGPDASETVRFPDPVVDPPDGEITLPHDPEPELENVET